MAEYTPTGTDTKQGNGSSLEGGLTGAAGQAASGLMAQVKTRASSQVAAQQARAADGLGNVAGALRKAGNELRSHNEGLASYADMAVDELEHISSRIRDKSPGEYVGDLEEFARRRPAAFVGSTFLLGLALARFLKSSQPRRSYASRYGSGQNGGRDHQWPRGYAGEPGRIGQRGDGASGSTSDAQARWPEAPRSSSAPIPGRTPGSATTASGGGSASTTDTQPHPGSFGETRSAESSGSRATQTSHARGEAAQASSSGSKSAAGRGRGTGDRS